MDLNDNSILKSKLFPYLTEKYVLKVSRKYRLTESVTNAGCISKVSKKMVDVTLDIILLSYQS